MKLISDNIDDGATGARVRLTRDTATRWVGRWPGPHRPGEVIHTTDGGCFAFDHLDPDTPGYPEAVWTWVADR